MSYRFILEKYRGVSTRYTCPKCGRKHTFTRYIDTENNNNYLSDNVGKCNRLDKCGYHYTPKQYFTDNPWLGEKRDVSFFQNIGKWKNGTATKSSPRPICTIPERVVAGSIARGVMADHVRWLINTYGAVETERVVQMYGIGASREGHSVFWQRDIEGRVRTGKIMAYDVVSGHRLKGSGGINWVHSIMLREGSLPKEWELTQCLYGEHLLPRYPDKVVAVVEAYKTAHVGAILMPDMVWVATDALQGLTAERLAPLRGRRVVLFPDEGRGYQLWSERIATIAREVGFDYRLSSFMEGRAQGADIADLVNAEEACPF